ncbi:MAG: DUF1232 domain-containing protein [Anaerolineae bacterium]|nr:DUF1232 domain-containing protein [Anaerolineae bacterium]
MLERLKKVMRDFRHELTVYRLVMAHPHTPLLPKILLGAAIGYFLSPIDLIPDVIPVFGQLDDLLIVPGLVLLAVRFIPAELMAECRAAAQAQDPD